ncbi:MAG: polymer-forming cytoskeletal protein [bacterium]
MRVKQKKKNNPVAVKSDSKGIRTLLGEGSQFKGALAFEGAVRIDGIMEGEVISEGSLYVGDKAVVMADVTVGSVVVCGKLSGNIVASQEVILKYPAEICGNIRSPVISMEEGVIFQGTCDMNKEEVSLQHVHLLENEELAGVPEEITDNLVDVVEN